jgi:hypothetical protein
MLMTGILQADRNIWKYSVSTGIPDSLDNTPVKMQIP